ncbi:hypothetical protein EDB83DRAFT_2315169 [Lactarius deliciosus]|nr:hypothetical protein EDB83DRAFT_2315169 [Lactarius deliciosus]
MSTFGVFGVLFSTNVVRDHLAVIAPLRLATLISATPVHAAHWPSLRQQSNNCRPASPHQAAVVDVFDVFTLIRDYRAQKTTELPKPTVRPDVIQGDDVERANSSFYGAGVRRSIDDWRSKYLDIS